MGGLLKSSRIEISHLLFTNDKLLSVTQLKNSYLCLMGSFMFSGCFRFENQIRKKQASIGRKDRGFGVFGLSIGVQEGYLSHQVFEHAIGNSVQVLLCVGSN